MDKAAQKIRLKALQVSASDMKKLIAREADLREEWRKEEPVLKEIRDLVVPYRGMFTSETADKDGKQKDGPIWTDVGMDSIEVMAAGMQSGITSPTRPWFRLNASNPEIFDLEPVRAYCDEVQRRMLAVYSSSNLYDSLKSLYVEIAAFGTAAMMMEEDDETIMRFRTLTCGEYTLGISAKLRVNKLARVIQMTADQLVEDFGEDVLPQQVKQVYGDGKNVTRVWKVYHMLEPNPNHDPRSDLEKKLPTLYRSVYWIEGKSDEPIKVEGYHECPFVAPRWEVVANQVYGRGPGWKSRATLKMLAKLEKNSMIGYDKVINPAILAPDNIRNINLMPNGVNRYSATGAEGGRVPISAVYEIKPVFMEIQNKIDIKENSVKEKFYVNLFKMLSSQIGPQKTAREVNELYAEKMLMLGPALERLHADLLSPIIERTYRVMLRMGKLPEAPPELEGEELKIEYVSILAQAQKMAGMTSIDGFIGFMGVLAKMNPEVVKRIDYGELVDRAAEAMGVPTGITFGADEYEEMERREAEARQQAQQAADMNQGIDMAGKLAGTAKEMAQIQTEDPNLLKQLMGGNQ